MRRHHLTATALALVALPVLATAGFAFARSAAAPTKSYLLKANLSPSRETPPAKGAPGATGLFTATLSVSGSKGTLAWRLTFQHLTGPALAAHVHTAPPGKAGPVAIPLCGPCKSGAHGVFTGPLGGNSALLAAILHGGAYANVHTTKHPNGEIRGQIRVTGTTTKAAASSGTTSTNKGGWG